ncbi:MAG: family 10 glycosylhydrolase [Candidatus Auribacterota bacterium]
MLRKIVASLLLFAMTGMLPVCAFAKTAIGLWVECQGSENSLGSKSSIDAMLADSRSMGVTDLFIQVHRGNRSWCKSAYSDQSPYNQFLAKEGFDPTAYIIKNAHQSGIKVHLWMNTFRILKNTDAPIIQALGTKILTRDGKKTLILDYPAEDLPDGSYWLDPGDLEVQEYLVKLVQDIMSNYPEADGVHLDFIRYPYRIPFYPGSQWAGGKSFGYGVDSVSRFQAATGLNPFEMELTRDNAQKWDDWKREQVNAFVRKIYAVTVPAKKQLSIAGICWADRAYLSAYQDWRGWLKEGIVDFVATMNYSIDTKFAYYLSREAIVSREKKQVMVGLGAYLLSDDPDSLARQMDDAVNLGTDGIIIFSYDSIKPLNRMKSMIAEKARSYNRQ